MYVVIDFPRSWLGRDEEKEGEKKVEFLFRLPIKRGGMGDTFLFPILPFSNIFFLLWPSCLPSEMGCEGAKGETQDLSLTKVENWITRLQLARPIKRYSSFFTHRIKQYIGRTKSMLELSRAHFLG